MTTSTSTSRTIDLPAATITLDEYGTNTDGSAVLLLHGGAGPRTVAGLGTALAPHAYVIAPTHPGFDGTPRPEHLDTIADLASTYLDLLDTLDLSRVLVIGNSIGGWIAGEMALRDNHRRLGALVLLNAVGIAPDNDTQLVDVRAIAPADISLLSFANPAYRPGFASFTDAQRAGMAANQKTLATYAGDTFTHDPKLRDRLHRVALPVLVAWGQQDGVATADYGRTYADAFPNGHYALIADAAHFPHIEQPDATLTAIGDFVDTVVKPGETA
ncbi:MAG TPA: alpha/beta hydrolase [Pseudonocardiaceae bacterium]|jgi:pimeloyl-ACP methyl ester carboxylesterase|nr:alpha/beta hydrolase [Pseudonocardiaceae bacterium]